MNLSKLAKTVGLGAAVVAVSAGAALAATATASVNVRTGPGTQYHVIDTLSPGQHVSINDRAGGWCEISQRGPDGWVSCAYLSGEGGYRGYRYNGEPDVSIQLGFGYPGMYPRPHHRYPDAGWDNYPHRAHHFPGNGPYPGHYPYPGHHPYPGGSFGMFGSN